MSKSTTTTTPTLPRGTQPLKASYALGKATVHYHDASGNAYNAQQRYVGKAPAPTPAPTGETPAKSAKK